jgi:hypothetical protein
MLDRNSDLVLDHVLQWLGPFLSDPSQETLT